MIDEFDAALSAGPIPRSSRRAYRARLASLRQLLFETRVIDTGATAAAVVTHASSSASPTWRWPPRSGLMLLRYIRVRAAVLRPKSVESLINDLLPFAEYLTAHHPTVTSLRELDRDCVEGYLAWNRTRRWRGHAPPPAPDAPSAAVAQSAVLSLRNLLEDIAAWGWAEAPTRQLVFAADVPKLDHPLPRALPPDVDAALMTAVAGLHDPFARVGLNVLRGAGLRVGELLDLELGASSTTARPGPGYGSRWASWPPNGRCR